jgi:hypothetical protein
MSREHFKAVLRRARTMAAAGTGKCPRCEASGIPLNSDGTLKVHPWGNHDDRSGNATACKGSGLPPVTMAQTFGVKPENGNMIAIGERNSAGHDEWYVERAETGFANKQVWVSDSASGALRSQPVPLAQVRQILR